ncbi:MAG: hypothetical protein PF961_22640 [Planctomycetota bacterium]|jgi:hypothetical protein|nr:hypothetical protein [Planctomycetota bacterium]
MSMRIDVGFERPLNREQKVVFLLTIAGLAKSRSVRWTQGGHGAVIMGIAMGRERVAEALATTDLPVDSIHSSLSEEEDEQADDALGAAGKGRERVRPIGR